MRNNAATEKGVLEIALGAIQELIHEHDVARFVFRLERTNGAGADDPRDAELFHRPDVGAMIQFAGQNAMAASVAWKENHVAPGKLAGEQFVRRRAERSFDLDPFLIREALNVIEAAAADDANAMLRHAGFYSG